MESRCIIIDGVEQMRVGAVPVPDRLPPGFALLEVEANGLCGSDHDLYTGALASVRPINYPLIPGHEVVGRLVATDPDAPLLSGFASGDRVAVEPMIRCGACPECSAGLVYNCRSARTYAMTPLTQSPGLWGGMSQYMAIHPSSVLHKLPEHLTPEDAVLFNPFGNAFDWVCRAGGVGVGSRVLVLGAGQRGLGCVVAAREAGADVIIITGLGRDEHKLEVAQELGATHVVNVERQDLSSLVREATGGEMADCAIDCVPVAAQPIHQGIECLAPGGTLVIAGVKGHAIDGVATDSVLGKSLGLQGVRGLSSWAVDRAISVVASGRYPLHLLHSDTVGLDDAEAAVRRLGDASDVAPIHITVVPR